jgi:hypothetical protein
MASADTDGPQAGRDGVGGCAAATIVWIEQQQADVDGTLYISVPECGIDRNATVHRIEACPLIVNGPGRVITATFRHQVAGGIELSVAEESQPIRCTGNHPIWSETRHDFVRADSLQPGETLRTTTGLTHVVSSKPLPGKTYVYNIEVHGLHVYNVGETGILTHNKCPKRQLLVSGSVARQNLDRALGGEVGDSLEAHDLITWQSRELDMIKRATDGGNGANNGVLLPRWLHQNTKYHAWYSAAVSKEITSYDKRT